MKTKKIFLTLTLLIAALSFGQQITSSFIVGGTIDKFYPVTFYDGGWYENTPTELTIGRSSVHMDENWRGSLMASFKFHSFAWGNGSSFIKAEIAKANAGTYSSFIAAWDDSSKSNGTYRIVIWFRGGGTTYYCKSNYAVNPVVYDSAAFNEENGPSRTFKTSVEDYVESATNLTSSGVSPIISIVGQNIFPANGNAGIGTILPQSKLDVRGIISTPEIAFRNADGGDDSDPYRLRKVQGGSDNNWLELQLNDNSDESFRIYGNSCTGFGCGEYSSNLYHSFDAQGNVYHRGNVGIGTTTPMSKLVIANGTDAISLNSGDINCLGFNRNVTDGAIFNPTKTAWQFSARNEMFTLEGYNGAAHNLFAVLNNGNVGIGITNPTDKLAVNGTIHAKEVRVDMLGWPDYVFANAYKLKPLASVEQYIKQKGHLPNVPSATEMEEKGLELSKIAKMQQEKIEELTLYLIQQNKEIEELKKQMKAILSKN